ncbi:hypothetical protein [Actinomadura latina]|uniref:Uncharacterized protein n=1 Tax=Actinomadura latina TaxID=163603 RepID=A0A846YRT1_9ACTN|nr:hypothetical protein [Actinomadura latina]NKZ02841.1 hypothetical protein [Actinomadura latina]
MGETALNEPVALLLLQHLFRPEWTITLDGDGVWHAVRQVSVSASDVDGLLDMIGAADAAAVERARYVMRER